MPSVFSRIISGEFPGRFVWRDDVAVAFLSINPLAPGHTLVVPRAEVDHWIDLDAGVAAHLFEVARLIAGAQQAAFAPARVGLMIAGFEVPHTHIHVVPVNDVHGLDFSRAEQHPDPALLDDAAGRLRRALEHRGHPIGS
ncbi:MAG: HIT family protein [Actinobacteria bacterium]|nr:HIT family protein [Actinomycetota bacterium]